MPAELLDAGGNLHQLVSRGEIDEPLDEVETHAAHAGFMQRMKFAISDVAADGRDAARSAGGMVERIDHRAVVGTVTGRLYNYIAREPEMIAQGKELRLRCIAGRVFALSRIGEFCAGTEDMTVRVDRA